MSMEETCKQIALLRELKEHHEAICESLGREIHKLSSIAYQGMVDANMAGLTISSNLFKDGQARIIKPDFKYAPKVGQQDQLYTWLRERNFGSIIKETIHPATLASFVATQKNNNQPLPPEDVLSVFTIETVSVRRAPKTAK